MTGSQVIVCFWGYCSNGVVDFLRVAMNFGAEFVHWLCLPGCSFLGIQRKVANKGRLGPGSQSDSWLARHHAVDGRC